MRRQADQVLAVGAIAMHQHHQMGGRARAGGRGDGTMCIVCVDCHEHGKFCALECRPMIVTRFAPSPTGLLHLGHAFAAITAYESGDDFLLRIEDIDKGRSRDKFIQAIFYDLKWLGLSWDEPCLRQSTRMGAYAEALVNLKAQTWSIPVSAPARKSPTEIARAGEAQHFDRPSGRTHLSRHLPGTCRGKTACAASRRAKSYALRLDVTKAAALTGPLTFVEHGCAMPSIPSASATS